MNVLDLVADTVRSVRPSASDEIISLEEWVGMFGLAGMPLGLTQTLAGNREEMEQTFPGIVAGAYAGNGVVFACAMTRFLLFSQARFQFQQMRGGQPGDMFGTAELAIAEKPWQGATTADLLAATDLDAQFAGNAFVVRRPGRLERFRPDWVGIIWGSRTNPDANPWDPDVEIAGYTYHPGGMALGEDPMFFLASEIAHYAPIRDPRSRVRGMSWITPVIREILGDSSAMRHKLAFFDQGATPNLLIKSDIRDTKKWRAWVEQFRAAHEGASNAYKTLHLQVGADAEAIGLGFRQISFKETMGHGETRIAAASGMHPVIVPLSEGMQGSSLNAGNFREAAQAIANAKLRPWWGNLMGSMETVVPARAGTRLWYDDRHIPFLADDIKDAADVLGTNANAIRTLTDGGYEPDSVIEAVTSGDLRRLRHAGYLPVQVQPIQRQDGDAAPAAALAFVPIPGFATASRDPGLPKPVGNMRAVTDFWPTSGLLAEYDAVPRGTILDASAPHVRAFPALFEPAEDLTSRARSLRAQGLTIPRIAASLDRTERHVRRLLADPAQTGAA